MACEYTETCRRPVLLGSSVTFPLLCPVCTLPPPALPPTLLPGFLPLLPVVISVGLQLPCLGHTLPGGDPVWMTVSGRKDPSEKRKGSSSRFQAPLDLPWRVWFKKRGKKGEFQNTHSLRKVESVLSVIYEAPQGEARAIMGVEGLKEHWQGRQEGPKGKLCFRRHGFLF